MGRVVGAVEAARLRLTRGTSEPELHASFLDRDGRGDALTGVRRANSRLKLWMENKGKVSLVWLPSIAN